jgi:enamine deaminase RidA (YjgF/YER057c/UK114 family)
MVVLQHVVAPDGVAAGRGYSHVVTGQGRLVVVSGQVAQNERGELVGPGDPALQARQVFENLRRCLAQAGAGFDDVVKLAFFVLDVADLPAVRAARDAVIDTARPPASTAVQVAALFAPGCLLEVEAWAIVGELTEPEPIRTASCWPPNPNPGVTGWHPTIRARAGRAREPSRDRATSRCGRTTPPGSAPGATGRRSCPA